MTSHPQIDADLHARAREQKLIDLFIEMIMSVYDDPSYFCGFEREGLAEWVRHNLELSGFSTHAVGSSWAVLK